MAAALVALVMLALLIAIAIVLVRHTWPHPPPPAELPPVTVVDPIAAALPALERVPAEPALAAPAIVRHRATRPAIVLVHGLFGFDTLGVGPARVTYFRGVARRLAARGVDVTIARLPPLAGVPARGRVLLAQLDAVPNERMTIVAHSLGGLDARWALARGDLADRVAGLVTIGTPHHGSPIADLFARGAPERLRAVLARLGFGTDAVDWLTTARMADFNRDIANVAGVRYASIVAATDQRARIHALLRVTHAVLARHGPSDGLVPAWSQAWGEVVGRAEIDHWAQVGWSRGHDAAALIEEALDAMAALPPARVPRQITAGAPVFS